MRDSLPAAMALGTAMVLALSAAAQDIPAKQERAAYCLGYVAAAKSEQYAYLFAGMSQALDDLQHRAAGYLLITRSNSQDDLSNMVLGKTAANRCFAAEEQCAQRCKNTGRLMGCLSGCVPTIPTCKVFDCMTFDPFAP